MNNIPTIKPKQKTYTIQQLNDYIALHEHLTGDKMKELKVEKDFYTWYHSQIQQTMKDFGLKGKLTDLIFREVKIVK